MSELGNPHQKLSYSISEVMALTGLGRTKLYEEINSGRLPARKSGRRTLILRSDLEGYLNGLVVFSAQQQVACNE